MGTKRSDVINHILQKQSQRTDIRREERKLPYSQTDGFGGFDGVENMSEAQKAHALLSQFIPPHLIPTNVGELQKVLWPKWYQVDFTSNDHSMFGTNPTIKPQDQSKKSFRTVQDAGFLLLGISRNFATHNNAGKGSPLEVTLRDNQSSRQINSAPIPLQSFAFNSLRTDLVSPYYFLPNSSFGVEIQTFIENDVTLVGDGRQLFTFFGLEVRSAELENVLHTIYSSQD
jgi:hypothetical protein